MELNIGDIVVCHKACIMSGFGDKTTTVGKSYSITELSKTQFVIIDDQGDRHYFNINDNVYFSTVKTIRLNKLNKLKDYEVR